MKWIWLAGAMVGCCVFLAFPSKAYCQTVIIYTGTNGQYIGQGTVITPPAPQK